MTVLPCTISPLALPSWFFSKPYTLWSEFLCGSEANDSCIFSLTNDNFWQIFTHVASVWHMTGHRCILTQNQTREIEIGKIVYPHPDICLLCSHTGPGFGRRIYFPAVRLCCMAGIGYPPEHTPGSRALGYRRPSEFDSRLENAPIQYRNMLIKSVTIWRSAGLVWL